MDRKYSEDKENNLDEIFANSILVDNVRTQREEKPDIERACSL